MHWALPPNSACPRASPSHLLVARLEFHEIVKVVAPATKRPPAWLALAPFALPGGYESLLAADQHEQIA